MPMKPYSHCLLIIAVVLGCTSREADQIPEAYRHLENLTVFPAGKEAPYQINLEREQSFGDTDETLIGRMGDIAVDERGRVYITDLQANTIHIYEPDGTHLQNIGREGSGPGEFRMIGAVELTDHLLLALGYDQFKISKYDLKTFEFVRDIDISLDDAGEQQPSWVDWMQDNGLFYRPIHFFVNSEGNYLLMFGDQTVGALDNLEGRTWEISIFNPSGEKYLAHDVHSLRADMNAFTFDDGSRISKVPFKPEAHLVSNGEQMVYGWGDDLLFKWYNTSGDYQQAFYYPRQNVSVKLDEIIAYYERDLANHEELRDHFLRRFRNSDLPEKWPSFHHLKIDDENRLWISTIVENVEIYEWWVVKSTGELIARFEWQRDEPIEVVKNGYMYTRQTDEDTGLQQINRYLFEWN